MRRSFRVFPRMNAWLVLILFDTFQVYHSFLSATSTDDHGDVDPDTHGGDDHSSSHSSSHEAHPESLFGGFYFIEPKYWTVSLIIVICAVLSIEVLFHVVHIFTEDSPFHKVVHALEKELMTVGVTAFIFKIVLNTLQISEEWFFSLEIADLLVPLFSFTNCFISMILILRSLRHCDIWSKAYHLRPAEILDEYTESSSITLTYMKWLPIFSQLMQEIEFRIIHDIFCDHYNVQRKAFAFDEYVSLIYERFVLNIIELRLIHWFAFLLVSFAYWIPNSVDRSLSDCEVEEETGRCAAMEETYLVTLFGALLFFVAVCFAMASRCYEKAVIKMAGVRSSSDYPQLLQAMDEAVDKQQVTESRRMDEEELKAVIKKAIHRSHDAAHGNGGHGGGHHGHSNRLIKAIRHFFASLEERMTDYFRRSKAGRRVGHHSDGGGGDDENAFTEAELKEMMNTSFKPLVINKPVRGNSNTSDNSQKEQKVDNQALDSPDIAGAIRPNGQQQQQQQQAPLPPVSSSSSNPGSPNNTAVHRKKVEVPPLPMSSATAGNANATTSASSSSPSSKKAPKSHSFHRDTDSEIKTIFLFQRPELYFEGVQFLLLPISLYFAVWFVEFSTIRSTPVLKFLSFLPGVLSMACYMTIVKSAALLKAIYHADKDVMLEVIEQTEGSRQLGATIRSKLLHRLSLQADDPFTTLRNLFAEIDANGSNQLSRLEFELLMDKLEVSFSRKKWKQIYHEIDRNYDDQISFDEFFIFLFPEHDLAKASEIKRLKKIRSRIAAKRGGGSPSSPGKANNNNGGSNKSSEGGGERNMYSEPSMLLIEDSERQQSSLKLQPLR